MRPSGLEAIGPDDQAGPWTYDDIVAAETAIEVLNRARGMISARLHDIAENDPALDMELRAKRRALLTLQHAISPENPEAAKAVTAMWGPRVKDDARFWREL